MGEVFPSLFWLLAGGNEPVRIDVDVPRTFAPLLDLARVPYEPDLDPYEEYPVRYNRLIAWVHMSTGKGLALRRQQGYSSEGVDQAFEEALRVAALLRLDRESAVGRPAVFISAEAAAGIAHFELSRLRRARGEYELALHHLASAVSRLSDSLDACFTGWQGAAEADQQLMSDVRWGIADLGFMAKEAVELVDAVLASPKPNWTQVAADCGMLAQEDWTVWEEWERTEDEDGSYQEIDFKTIVVNGALGQGMSFFSYFSRAQGRAEEALKPNELRDYWMDRLEKGDRDRLEKFFFPGGLWDVLPSTAQDALVDADHHWIAFKGGRVERIIGDLADACQASCDDLLAAVRARVTNDALVPVLDKWRDGFEHPGTPNLNNYAGLFQTEEFAALLAERLESGGAKAPWFLRDPKQRSWVLRKDLPRQLKFLANQSNLQKHESAKEWARSDVAEILQQCLGVQTQGLLWRLAHIKRAISDQWTESSGGPLQER